MTIYDRKAVDQTEKELSSQRIQWKFITERAPWMGRYWERWIKSIKIFLVKTLQQALADEEDLRTILCEIGARLNLRPLTHLSSERKDLEMLTLYHF
ncbi:hypothetical protein T06_9388 [Trichinella sp. T6]|nr:hypothetical protein T06_9388 [Trichinella sp. T6]